MMTGQDRNNMLFVADAIRQAFGLNSPVYIPYGRNSHYEAAPYEIGEYAVHDQIGEYSDIKLIQETEADDADFSEFGTPALGTITFDSGEYNTYNKKTGAVKKVSMAAYTLPYSCIVTYSLNSNLNKTDVLGSTGTVKELYGKGDWEMTIRGISIPSRDGIGMSAQEQINQLVKWSNICDSIPVIGSIFREKGINNIVIESISIQPVVGRWDAIPFQIEAVSDEPIELYLL